MKAFAMFGLALLLGFSASAQIPSDTTLRIQITKITETNFSGIVSNTQADILYEFQYRTSHTNWISMGFFDGSELTNYTSFHQWFPGNINSNNFRVRSWINSYHIGIPDWWQMKYFGNVGIDAYADPMNDGWNNIQKWQNHMNPFKGYPPVEKTEFNLEFRKSSDAKHKDAILTLLCNTREAPDFYIIERANRSLQPMTNNWQNWQRGNLIITGAYQFVARIKGQSNKWNRYIDTNLDFSLEPIYRVRAHYTELAPFSELSEVSATAISNTILSVTAKPQTNGYELTVLRPMVHARYLLLVRDEINRQWRASGYFVSGTNRNDLHLHVDKKGMMSTNAQSPIILPAMSFLPDVVQPEFTAGWGEDSDGDGLPDIYEVLVTHTQPDDANTGDTGIQDGYRVFAGGGWNNWDKFRYRANPFQKCEPPPAVVLTKPTLSEFIEAQTLKTDLPYEAKIEIRTNGAASFQPLSWLGNDLPRNQYEHACGDVRVSWKVPPPRP